MIQFLLSHLWLPITYAFIAVSLLVFGLIDTIKNEHNGPSSFVGYIGVLLLAAVLAPFWLPILVGLGFDWADQKLGQRKTVKALRKDAKARGECSECHRVHGQSTFNPNTHVLMERWRYDQLQRALKMLDEYNWRNPQHLGANPKGYNPYNQPGPYSYDYYYKR